MAGYDAHDARSLRVIRRDRAALVHEALRSEPDLEAALALVRLIEIEGAAPDLLEVVEHALPHARGIVLERLQLARARLDFEAGQLPEAQRRLEVLLEEASADEVKVTAALALVRLSLAGGLSAAERLRVAKEIHGRTHESWPWVDALLHNTEAGLAMRDARRNEAREHWQRALDLALSYDGSLEASLSAGCLGNLELDLGHDEAAEAWFGEAMRLGRRVGAASTVAIFGGYRGWAIQLLGHAERARRAYAKAITDCEALGLARFAAQFRALRATVALRPGNIERRELEYREALAALRNTGDLERASALAVLRALFEVARAQRAPTMAETHRRLIVAHRHLQRAARSSDDGRTAERQAARVIDSVLLAAPAAAELIIVPGGEAGRGPSGVFDLARHGTLQRLLWALVESWAEGRAVTDDELIAWTWPGERMAASAATRRLQVGISSLRKQALGELLHRVPGGYELRAGLVALTRSPIEPD